MNRRFRRTSPAVVVAALVLAALAASGIWRHWQAAPSAQPLAEGSYRVSRVVDGDTLLLAGGLRVRLIGVNAPESVKPDHPVEPWGPEASQFTRDFVSAGTVRLSFDRERLDQYGRALAYVWVGERLLNEELLLAGLAQWEPQYHYSAAMKRRFRRAQEQAQRERRGIWSGDAAPPSEKSMWN